MCTIIDDVYLQSHRRWSIIDTVLPITSVSPIKSPFRFHPQNICSCVFNFPWLKKLRRSVEGNTLIVGAAWWYRMSCIDCTRFGRLTWKHVDHRTLPKLWIHCWYVWWNQVFGPWIRNHNICGMWFFILFGIGPVLVNNGQIGYRSYPMWYLHGFIKYLMTSSGPPPAPQPSWQQSICID